MTTDTQLVTVPDNVTKALDWPATAIALKVTSGPALEKAGETLKAIKALRKEVSETFGPIVKKANEAVREARKQRSKYDDPLNLAERLIKGKMSTFVMAREAKERERLAVAQKKEDKKAVKEERPAAPVVKREVPKVENIHYVDKWDYEITDESKIPRKFMTPNLKMIGEHVRTMKDKADIAGVTVTKKKIVSAGT